MIDAKQNPTAPSSAPLMQRRLTSPHPTFPQNNRLLAAFEPFAITQTVGGVSCEIPNGLNVDDTL